MRLSTLAFVVLSLSVILLTTNAVQDPRQRFEGLIGATVQAAWVKIDREGLYFICILL
jgi:hypothetical protein